MVRHSNRFVRLGSEEEQATGGHRDVTNPKTVNSRGERVVPCVPRDRHGRFDAAPIGKYHRRRIAA